MSQQHEAIVRRLFDEVLNQGKLETINTLVTPDFVNNDPVEPARGQEGLKKIVSKYRQAFPDLRFEIEELISNNQRVVARYRYSGTHRGMLDTIPPTGRHCTGTGIAVYGFRGTQIQEGFEAWDALGLMQQLGVVTLPGKAAGAGR
jgi:steroid delta-isomerase-like uncharacterized protein